MLLAPSERAVVDVLFDTPGEVRLEHRTPDRVYDLGAFTVSGDLGRDSRGDVRGAAHRPGTDRRARPSWQRPRPTAGQGARVRRLSCRCSTAERGQTSSYACPMHPEVTASEPGTCPQCGMKLVPAQASRPSTSYACPMHPEVTASEPGTCPKCGMKLVPCSRSRRAIVLLRLPHASGGHGSEPGTCPKCGMKLVPTDAAPPAAKDEPAGHDHERRRPRVGGPDA